MSEQWTEAKFRGHLNRMRKQLAYRAELAVHDLMVYKVPDDLVPSPDIRADIASIKEMATEMLEKLDDSV